jgi:hypothetical protein
VAVELAGRGTSCRCRFRRRRWRWEIVEGPPRNSTDGGCAFAVYLRKIYIAPPESQPCGSRRVGTQRVRHSLGTQYSNSRFSVGGAAVAI